MRNRLLIAALLVLSLLGSAKATVTCSTNKIVYNGTNNTTVFPFGFPIYNSTDLQVIVANTTTNNTTSLGLSSDYNISLTTPTKLPSGGSIGLQSTGAYPTIPVGNNLTIKRTLPLTQLLSFKNNEAIPASTFQEGFDRATMLAQQAYDYVSNITGPAGPAGTPGTNGVNGTNGSQGATGPQGTQGAAGSQGPAGPAGNGTGNVIVNSTLVTANYVPVWNATNNSILNGGYPVGTTGNNTILLTNATGVILVNSTGNALTATSATTAANLTGTPVLPNGTTAFTQAQGNNTTVVATTAYVDTGLATKLASNGTAVNASMLQGYTLGTGGYQIVQLDQYAKLPAVDGSRLTNILGTWVDKSGNYGAQQATTDGFVITIAYGGDIIFFTDSANPPTLEKGRIITNTDRGTICCPVKKGDYWLLIKSAGATIESCSWISLGS